MVVVGRRRRWRCPDVDLADRHVDAVAVDGSGRARPEWARSVLGGSAPLERIVDERVGGADWAAAIGGLARRLSPDRTPVLLAALIVRPEPSA